MQKQAVFSHRARTGNVLKAAIAAVTLTVGGAAIAEPDSTTSTQGMTGDKSGTMTESRTETMTETMTGESALTVTEQEQMQFDQLDANGNGYLDREEFSAATGVTGADGATSVDTDQDGKISPTEFAAFETSRTGGTPSAEQAPDHQAMDPAERPQHSTTSDEQPSVDPGP